LVLRIGELLEQFGNPPLSIVIQRRLILLPHLLQLEDSFANVSAQSGIGRDREKAYQDAHKRRNN
jgi:hypothetical protein